MSNQKLNLANIPGIHEIEDNQAEVIFAGAFRYTTSAVRGRTKSTFASISLAGATKLQIRNTDPDKSDPNAGGNNFRVTFFDFFGQELGSRRVTFGKGVRTKALKRFLDRGAVIANIEQARAISLDV